jgi:hypothetical protein
MYTGLTNLGLNGRSSSFNPANLFVKNEQGAWYDPSDFSSMYQDSAGTTPVTAVEQPVGLLLDKRLGLVRGAELVVNGAAPVGTTGWSTGGSGVPTLTESGGVLTLTSTGVGSLVATNTGSLVAGTTYEITVNVTAKNAVMHVRTAGGGLDASPLTLNVGLNRFIATPSISGVLNVGNVGSVGAGSTISFNGVSAKALPGNHALQATAASRPVLSARYNLLTKSEQFDNAAWSVVLGAAVTPDTVLAPDGTLTADTITFASTDYRYQQINTGSPIVGKSYTYSVSVWSPTKAKICVRMVNSADGADEVKQQVNLSAGATRITLTRAFTGAGNSIDIGVDNRTAVGADAIAGAIYAWGADLRLTADTALNIPAYQRVNTATDYDTAGFPHYLKFDGVDDGMATGTVDFTATDKATAWAGVTKLSDAARAVVFRHEGGGGAQRISFEAPNSSLGNYEFVSGGTLNVSVASASVAPITSVLCGIGDIAGDVATLRVNGVQTATSAADQGTGSHANAALYVGKSPAATLPFNGRLYSLIVRGVTSNAAQIAQTETYVAQKTGVVL